VRAFALAEHALLPHQFDGMLIRLARVGVFAPAMQREAEMIPRAPILRQQPRSFFKLGGGLLRPVAIEVFAPFQHRTRAGRFATGAKD